MFRRNPSVVVLPGRTETQYVTREVHEHRAPTDESVKLLREMEVASEAKRIGSLQVQGNGFNCLLQTWLDGPSGLVRATAVADLNGKRIVAEATGDQFSPDREKLLTDLRDDLARRIANEVLVVAILQLPPGSFT
jgi:hypothetical protein